jgi:hypothetical protein
MKQYNLISEQVKAEYAEYIKNHTAYIMDCTPECNLDRVKAYTTRTRSEQYDAGKITFEELQRFAVDRTARRYEKECAEKLERLQRYAEAGDVKEISISVEWHKSRTWGYNPLATVRIYGDNVAAVRTGTASGCGYDKESAAIGEALNSVPAMRRILCDMKETALQAGANGNSASKSNEAYIEYGAGYGAIPYFEGGVGFSCFERIFIKAGFKRTAYNSGKIYDLYVYTKEA